jgi:DnaD/phage-associated family protein
MALRAFLGFDKEVENGKAVRFTGVPASFFSEILPQITNIAELKVLLQLFYLAGQKRGEPKWVGYWELENSPELRTGLRRPGDPRPPEELLREGLELALTRGTIIRLVAAPAPSEFIFKGELEPVEPTKATWFLLNTASNRAFVKALETGNVQIENTTLLQGLDIWDAPLPQQTGRKMRVNSKKHDIFSLYEQNIGALTPILSEKLREAAQIYPPEWIEEAFLHAVSYNRRSWAYISRILENWTIEGKTEADTPVSNSRLKEYGQESRGQELRESTPPLGRDGGRRARSDRAGDGGRNVAANGANASGTHPQPPSGIQSNRYAPPYRDGRPLDPTKYTSGKYAFLTQSAADAEEYPGETDE